MLWPTKPCALGKALTFDPAAIGAAPGKPLRLPGYSEGKPLDVSRDDRPDGSSSFTVKKPLPIDIETKLGADLAPTAPSTFQPGQPLPGSLNSRDSGAAWASIGVPNLASVDARVDPDGDQGKVGTTLQHGIPVGSRFKVTVQDTISVTDTLGSRSTASAGRAAAGRAAAGVVDADTSLGQRKKSEVRRLADRNQPVGRRHHQQHRPGQPQYAQRRSEDLRPLARDHLGLRPRRTDQQQDHFCRIQAALVAPS